MRRRIWRDIWARRGGRAGFSVLFFFVLLAALADCVASDLPVALSFRDKTYLMPAWTRPAALTAYDNQRLREELGTNDWALWPICEFGPEQQPKILRSPPASPDSLHWLGTDDRGRDVFSRLVHGTRVSLAVGLFAVCIYVLLGTLLGLLAGYFRGWVDWIVSRLVELGLAFPTFFLVLTVMAVMGRSSLWTMMIVIGLTGWAGVARLVRAEALRIRELPYVAASRLAGASHLRVVLWHVLPNALAPVVVSAAFGVGGAILMESALSFLGFGTPPPTASWGELLGQAYEHPGAWWLVVLPGVLVLLAVTAVNLLGEALRQALDPRLRQR